MQTLNVRTFATAILISAIAFVSCSKKKDDVAPPVPENKIYGSWLGKYGSGNNAPDAHYSFNILPGGILQTKNANNGINGTGTWELTEQTFTAVYKYNNGLSKYIIAAKYDEEKGQLNGSWGSGEVSADDGEFFLNKQ